MRPLLWTGRTIMPGMMKSRIISIYTPAWRLSRVVQNYLETEDLSQSRRLVERIIDIFIKESSRYFESELDIEIFGQLFQAIAIMLLKEKRGTEDLVTDLSKIVFKEESGRVSKKMINHARSWLYLSHVIGYCSKSINCDFIR